MRDFYDEMDARKLFLSGIIKEKEQSLKDTPAGNLRIDPKRGYPHYYHMTKKGDTKGKYIRTKDIDLAKALAQKDYDQKVLKAAKRELYFLDGLLKLQDKTIEAIFTKLSLARQTLIIPAVSTDEQFIKAWYERNRCEPMGFRADAPVIIASNGERVRSKSEQLWMNTLLDMKVPTIYEPKLFLKGRGWIRPDFCMLNVRKRKEIYGEHFGMMDIPEYADSAAEKMRDYERSGFVLGDNLIITFETKKYPLEAKKLKELLERHLL